MIGKTATEVYKDAPPYIDIYANYSIAEKPYRFETYYEKMDKHFDIIIYSIEPNAFITIFSDVSERVKSETLIRSSQRLESIGILARRRCS